MSDLISSDEEIEEDILNIAKSLIEKIQGIMQIPPNINPKHPKVRYQIESTVLSIILDNEKGIKDSYKKMDSWCFHNMLLTFIMDMLVTSLNNAVKMMTDFDYEDMELEDKIIIKGSKKIN